MTIDQKITIAVLIAQAILASPGIASLLVGIQRRRKQKAEDARDKADTQKVEADGVQSISASSIALVKQYREDQALMRLQIAELQALNIKMITRIDRLTAQVIALGGIPEAL